MMCGLYRYFTLLDRSDLTLDLISSDVDDTENDALINCVPRDNFNNYPDQIDRSKKQLA